MAGTSMTNIHNEYAYLEKNMLLAMMDLYT